jgi:hypothetical protein
LVWPPYLVEPPYIEGNFEENQGTLGLSPSIIMDLYPKKLFPPTSPPGGEVLQGE